MFIELEPASHHDLEKVMKRSGYLHAAGVGLSQPKDPSLPRHGVSLLQRPVLDTRNSPYILRLSRSQLKVHTRSELETSLYWRVNPRYHSNRYHRAPGKPGSKATPRAESFQCHLLLP